MIPILRRYCILWFLLLCLGCGDQEVDGSYVICAQDHQPYMTRMYLILDQGKVFLWYRGDMGQPGEERMPFVGRYSISGSSLKAEFDTQDLKEGHLDFKIRDEAGIPVVGLVLELPGTQEEESNRTLSPELKRIGPPDYSWRGSENVAYGPGWAAAFPSCSK